MRRLQREIYNLNKWRSENSLQEQKIKDYDRVIEQLKKQVADQNDMINISTEPTRGENVLDLFSLMMKIIHMTKLM